MKKRLIFILLVFSIIFISGCAVEEVPKEISQDIIDVEQNLVKELVAEDISHVQEDYEEFLEDAAEDNIEVSEDFINQFNSLLDLAIKEFEQDNFVEARRLVEQAETLFDDADDDADDDAEEQEYEEVLTYWQSIWNPSIEAAFSEKPCNTSKKPFEFNAEPYYMGPLFDAHLHLIGPESEGMTGVEDDRLFINPENADDFFAMMDKQGVIGLIGFLPINHENFISAQAFNDLILNPAGAVVNRSCERIIPFLYPTSRIGVDPTELKLELIDDYIKDNSIPFKGIGELHGGDYPGEEVPIYAGHKLNDQVMLELYDYAAENNLVVMIHPQVIDLEDLRDALQHNRKTVFLLHGGNGVEKFLPTLFQEYENLYYSLDAILLGDSDIAGDGMTKEEVMNNLQSKRMRYRLLAAALNNWKPLIEAYPDRMMWGTDALYSWHFDHDLYSEVTWFARDFIGGLRPEVQERFAYQNAEELIAKVS